MMLRFQCSCLAEQTVTLSWHPSSGSGSTGYNVYYGTSSHNYSQKISVGNTNTATISGLASGATYYFAATTYDGLGNESIFSNETSYTMPLLSPAAVSVPASIESVFNHGGQFGFSFSGGANTQYVVQTSTNLVTWQPVETNVSPFTFTDSSIAGSGQRFYRVVAF